MNSRFFSIHADLCHMSSNKNFEKTEILDLVMINYGEIYYGETLMYIKILMYFIPLVMINYGSNPQ